MRLWCSFCRHTALAALAQLRQAAIRNALCGHIQLALADAGTGGDGAAEHWLAWRRRHQALSAWYHQRTRLSRNVTSSQVR